MLVDVKANFPESVKNCDTAESPTLRMPLSKVAYTPPALMVKDRKHLWSAFLVSRDP